MIKTHPTELMLRAFAADELPLPLAVGVSAHCELCPECAASLRACEEELARQYLEPADQPAAISETMPLELDAMLAGILQQPVASPAELGQPVRPAPELRVAGQSYHLPRVLAAFMLITAVMLLVFTTIGSSYLAALGMGLLIGLFSNGCVAGLYALSPVVYDASVRATGVGWGIGIGRMGAILSPTVAGVLLDGGWQPLHLYGVFASVFVLAAGCLLLLRPTTKPASALPADALSH